MSQEHVMPAEQSITRSLGSSKARLHLSTYSSLARHIQDTPLTPCGTSTSEQPPEKDLTAFELVTDGCLADLLFAQSNLFCSQIAARLLST